MHTPRSTTTTAAAATPAPVGNGMVETIGAYTTEKVAITAWLRSVHPNLVPYADKLANYGYEDTDMLIDADEQDLADAFDAVQMKKPHRRKFMTAFAKFLVEQPPTPIDFQARHIAPTS